MGGCLSLDYLFKLCSVVSHYRVRNMRPCTRNCFSCSISFLVLFYTSSVIVVSVKVVAAVKINCIMSLVRIELKSGKMIL